MMADRENTATTRGNNTAIPSRDGDGNEHHLLVSDHPVDLVAISDDMFLRVLSPQNAIRLAVELIATTGRTSDWLNSKL